MPEKKPVAAFDVPSDVSTASQSGWVYRSEPAVSPVASSEPGTRPAGAVTRVTPARPSWADRATGLLALPFSVPLCFILSLASPPRRTTPKSRRGTGGAE